MSSTKNPDTEISDDDKEAWDKLNKAMDEAARMAASETETAGTAKVIENTVSIVHKGFQSDDVKQQMVQYAYELGGLDFVLMIECENGNWSLNAVGDSGRAHGLCQINTRYHTLPEGYKDDWKVQLDYCYQKWSTGTKFYGPSRRIKGQTCANYVKNRFIIN